MDLKSNITVESNIYNRIHDDVNFDKPFVASVTDGKALHGLDNLLRKDLFILSEGTHGSQVNAKLSLPQKQELNESAGCPNNRGKQRTRGLVRREGKVVWECRCEHRNCKNYRLCMPKPFVRENKAFTIIRDEIVTEDLEYKWLGTVENIFEPPMGIEEELVQDEIPSERFFEPIIETSEFEKIEEPDDIIYADINSKILVNAGPGTGKTNAVIERLAFIMESLEVDLGQVLVLCYTNAARDVILQRLDEKGYSEEARQLVVCTFDSLAWNNLSQKTDEDLFALGYNGCIEKFNAEFDLDEWADFEYIIIDELQDLVNDRAKMTTKILTAVRCGYLILGDNCQAIYDYDCIDHENIDSVKFYSMINDLLPVDAKKYELVGNWRQSTQLTNRSDGFRDVLLTYDINMTNDYFMQEIMNTSFLKFSADYFRSLSNIGTTAILTRNNGEAEWISNELCKKNVPHNLLRQISPQPSFNRWIADLFWDYRKQRIGKEDFIERFLIRVNQDKHIAEETYYAIIDSLGQKDAIDKDSFEVKQLSNALRQWQYINTRLLVESDAELTVSTIHKAKGREFDNVYIYGGFSPNCDNTQEARVWYVGITRAKTKLEQLSKENLYLRKPKTSNRWLSTARKAFTKWTFCNRIVVGLFSDVDDKGFVFGDLQNAVKVQEHIAKKVDKYDSVELHLINNLYMIYHKGMYIGHLSSHVITEMLESIKSIIYWNKELPSRLLNVYVSEIVTVTRNLDSSGAAPMFKDSGFWLGVEISGFAKADWNWKGVSE